MTIDTQLLASAYNKPESYIKLILKHHNINSLPRFRTPDDGLGPFYSDLTGHYNDQPSRTLQEFAAECDINNIMARFQQSNYDPSTLPMNSKTAQYGDFTSMPDSYHSALNYVLATEDHFLTLPAAIRARFENDPQQFLDFVSDPKNQQELIDLGLASARTPAPAPTNSAVGSEGDASVPLVPKTSSKPSTGSKAD